MTALSEYSMEALFRENEELRQQLAQHSETVLQQAAILQQQAELIQLLKDQLEWFRQNLFGPRSERHAPLINSQQLYLEGFELKSEEAEEENGDEPSPTPKSRKRKKREATGKDKIQLPEDIPIEEIYLDVPEEDKVCSQTGKPLVKIGEEKTSKLAHVPDSYYIKQFIRPVYAYPEETDQGILTAELPDSLLPKCQADESLLAELCVRKYGDHLPLYRLVEIFARNGVIFSRQLLSQWVLKTAQALSPLYTLMQSKCLEGDICHIDESPVKLLGQNKGRAHQAYMWLWVGGEGGGAHYSVYHFKLDRRHIHAQELLRGYTGHVHADKYEAYAKLAKAGLILWCPCWAHIRRYFFEAEAAQGFRNWCLEKIKELFMLERQAWDKPPDERLQIRVEIEIPIIDELLEATHERLYSDKDRPKSKMRKALGYFCDLKPFLKNYTTNAYARLENNPVERQIRPLAIGRKNWLFMGGEQGGHAAAILLSLIQTCRSLQINPREYLEDVMRRINGHPYNRLNELLPDVWAKQCETNVFEE